MSIGAGAFTGGLSTLEYGREKGNSQLAVLEETGLVGFVLYLIVNVILLTKLAQECLRQNELRARVASGLALGAVIGLIINSFFEAWWVAPGSTEFPFFCAICGIGIGLTQISLRYVQPLDNSKPTNDVSGLSVALATGRQC